MAPRLQITGEFLAASLRTVVIDVLGVFWGLRSSADGKSAGEPVVIFGGEHADVPLEHTAGELIADLVVDEPIAAVLDLSSMSKTQARQFVAQFAERIFRRNRLPLHIVVDECDAFAPQRTFREGARCLGAMEDLARRGRTRGIGLTMITQRPASLHKDLLTQAEVLIAMRMTGPRDVGAIDEWVRLHADEDEAVKVKASLPSLPVGTAWVWSPGWLGILKQVAVRRARTFDSSATPKPGQRRIEPKRMAPVDIERLRERLGATIDRAHADDPLTLRNRIADLEKQLATRPHATVERVEVPVLSAEGHAHLDHLLEQVQQAGEEHREAYANLGAQITDAVARLQSVPKPSPASPPPPVTPPARPPRVTAPTDPPPRSTVSNGLPKAQKAILTVLATYGPRSKTQTAILTGYASSGGGFNNALGALRSAGYLEGREQLHITQSGVDTLGPVDSLPTGPRLVEHWQSRLGKAQSRILGALVEAWPNAITKDELADRTGYVADGGGFNNALGRLRRLELISGSQELRAADTLASD